MGTSDAMPYWEWDGQRDQASYTDALVDDWPEFAEWVEGLPERFPRLKEFVRSGRSGNRTALGLELCDAWEQFRKPGAWRAVRALANGIKWRLIQWARANNYDCPPDPAELVVFREGDSEDEEDTSED